MTKDKNGQLVRYPQYLIDGEYLGECAEMLIRRHGDIFVVLYEMGYDPTDFVEKFMTGPDADIWDGVLGLYMGFYSKAAAMEWQCDMEDANMDLRKLEDMPQEYRSIAPDGKFDVAALKWIGQAYESWQRYTLEGSRNIYKKLNFADMYACYGLGHMMDVFAWVLDVTDTPEKYLEYRVSK